MPIVISTKRPSGNVARRSKPASASYSNTWRRSGLGVSPKLGRTPKLALKALYRHLYRHLSPHLVFSQKHMVDYLLGRLGLDARCRDVVTEGLGFERVDASLSDHQVQQSGGVSYRVEYELVVPEAGFK
jgi:hypothetical protein